MGLFCNVCIFCGTHAAFWKEVAKTLTRKKFTLKKPDKYYTFAIWTATISSYDDACKIIDMFAGYMTVLVVAQLDVEGHSLHSLAGVRYMKHDKSIQCLNSWGCNNIPFLAVHRKMFTRAYLIDPWLLCETRWSKSNDRTEVKSPESSVSEEWNYVITAVRKHFPHVK